MAKYHQPAVNAAASHSAGTGDVSVPCQQILQPAPGAGPPAQRSPRAPPRTAGPRPAPGRRTAARRPSPAVAGRSARCAHPGCPAVPGWSPARGCPGRRPGSVLRTRPPRRSRARGCPVRAATGPYPAAPRPPHDVRRPRRRARRRAGRDREGPAGDGCWVRVASARPGWPRWSPRTPSRCSRAAGVRGSGAGTRRVRGQGGRNRARVTEGSHQPLDDRTRADRRWGPAPAPRSGPAPPAPTGRPSRTCAAATTRDFPP